MTLDEVRNTCLSFRGATEQIQWDDDLVFKVAGKMFLVTSLEPGGGLSFKCEDETYSNLTELPGVRPAPYLARARWVQIDPSECTLDNTEIERLIGHSYDLVVARLPKKTQQMLAESAKPSSERQRSEPQVRSARSKH